MKKITTPPFANVTCFNLGSLSPRWIELIPSLLDELAQAASKRTTGVPVTLIKKRFSGLKYICLVPPELVRRSRKIPFVEIGDGADNDNQETSLEQSIDNALAEIEYEKDNNEERDWDEYNHDYNDSIDNHRAENRNDSDPSNRDPIIGTLEESENIGSTTVVVDYYGIYTSSLRKWAQAIKDRGGPVSGQLRCLCDKFSRDSTLVDGPAILLCPENIAEIPSMLMRRLDPPVYRMAEPCGNILLQYLRIVLFHEIGHHVFPVDPNLPSTLNLNEAMANWFAFLHLTPADRCAMHLLSETQKLPYRLYQGIVGWAHYKTLGSHQENDYRPIIETILNNKQWRHLLDDTIHSMPTHNIWRELRVSDGELESLFKRSDITPWDFIRRLERSCFGNDRCMAIGTKNDPENLLRSATSMAMRIDRSCTTKPSNLVELYQLILICDMLNNSTNYPFNSRHPKLLNKTRQLRWHQNSWINKLPKTLPEWTDLAD